MQEGYNLFASLGGTFEFQKVKDRMSYTMRTLSKYHDVFMKANLYSRGNRMEPLTILIRGGSGLGKSRLMPSLTFELMARIMDDERL